ncbi:MAG TPA: acyltransferase [Burkholderiaceae bacterium]|nr:acyltransferase [Burkholderiaceae bacterium]
MLPKRFEFLDGIRGIAAIFVLMRHTSTLWNFPVYRSYLAVDIFFILSGFVIAHAYDRRLATGALAWRRFVLIRLIRLYPVFLLSLLLCGALWAAKIMHQQLPDYGLLAQLAVAMLLHALFLPAHMGASTALFPVNGPYWSLLFELVANFLYGAVRPLMSRRGNIAMLICSSIVVAGVGYRQGNLDFGYDWGLLSMVGGLARALFGFFFGLLLYQSHEAFLQRLRGRVSPWVAIAAVAAVLASPGAGALDPWLDMAAIVLVFPLCVLVGAQRPATTGVLTQGLMLLGAASYPLYVMHRPVAQLLHGVLGHLPPPLGGLVLTALVVMLSVWMERRLDIPLRRALTARLVQGAATVGEGRPAGSKG